MEDFLWGVATSAYQSEGGYNGTDQPQTNWAEAERRGDVVPAGLAADFWHRYREDFGRCRELGLNAFRLGIEWSRVQPTIRSEPGPPPAFDERALERYAEILAECRRAALEPVVTLHHFIHPAWLGSDPWLEPRTIEQYLHYVEYTVLYLNRALTDRYGLAPIRYYITINEPNMLVLNTYLGTQFPGRKGVRAGFRTVSEASRQILRAHVRAYNRIHDIYEQQSWPVPLVACNNYCTDLYWSDKVMLDLLSVRERDVKSSQLPEYVYNKIQEFENAFEQARIPLVKDIPYFFGSLTKRLSNWIGYKTFSPGFFAPLVDEIYSADRVTTFDFLGLDYYDPFAAHVFRLPVWWDHEFKDKNFRSWLMNNITSKWWDWRVLPAGMRFFCESYSKDYAGRPVLIAENGMALRRKLDNRVGHRRDRMTRSQFLRVHIEEVVRMVRAEIPLIGYLHWSLFDNYEWGSFTPRFGLYSIDYEQGRDRMLEDYFGDIPSVTYAQLIESARQRMAEVGESEVA
ncbi:MAG: glycoside hydrolase family 1 protein [Verrucomicrobia bacterium]|nr:glycoside hydrolase family 1 protein [Verrucomicrobiota bacterium]